MQFRFEDSVPVLSRTPGVLRLWLSDLSPHWTDARDGAGTWSPYDVLGHLIHGERTDWIPRAEHILRHGDTVPFPKFDREGMFEASKGRSLGELLGTFEALREESLGKLEALNLTESDLARRGLHPELGPVTLGQHLATWVAHDMSHLAQIVRTMARQYTEAVGPWVAYLSVLKARS